MTAITKKTSKIRRKKLNPIEKLQHEADINPHVVVSPEIFDSLIAQAGKKHKPNAALQTLMQHYRQTIKTTK